MKTKKKIAEFLATPNYQKYRMEPFVIMATAEGKDIIGDVDEFRPINLGMTYRFIGEWYENPKHGMQFKFISYTPDYKNSEDGIIKYLCHHAPGIGQAKARELYKAFGSDIIQLLEDHDPNVAASGIVTDLQCKIVSDTFKRTSVSRKVAVDLCDLFYGRSFPKKIIPICIARYGADAPNIIKKNPYTLVFDSIPGCGFKRVDRLYLELGLDPDAKIRQIVCAWNAISSTYDGSTWHTLETACNAIRGAVSSTQIRPKEAIYEGYKLKILDIISKDAVKPKDNKEAAELIKSGNCFIADYKKSQEEESLITHVRRLLSATELNWPGGKIEGLTDHQNEKASIAMSSHIGILCGKPGTGKTYTTGRIVREIINQVGANRIAITAPTGKAAVRLTKSLSDAGLSIKATTIHAHLGVSQDSSSKEGFKFQKGFSNPSPEKYLIVDEVSMASVSLLGSLLASCQPGTHVLLVGDPNQLPPIGHGAPLSDLIKILPSVGELSEIQRNSGSIVKACHAIADGKAFDFDESVNFKKGKNFIHVNSSTGEETVSKIIGMVPKLAKMGFKSEMDYQVICPINSKSACCKDAINSALQNSLRDTSKQRAGKFLVGDKIICLTNGFYPSMRTYDSRSYYTYTDSSGSVAKDFVANGEIGECIAVNGSEAIMKFQFPDRTVKHLVSKFESSGDGDGEETKQDAFDLAYGVTGHKMQGSETNVIIVVVDSFPSAKMVASREWYYTGFSRARKLCIVIGKKATLIDHLIKVVTSTRRTMVKEIFFGQPELIPDHIREIFEREGKCKKLSKRLSQSQSTATNNSPGDSKESKAIPKPKTEPSKSKPKSKTSKPATTQSSGWKRRSR